MPVLEILVAKVVKIAAKVVKFVAHLGKMFHPAGRGLSLPVLIYDIRICKLTVTGQP